MGAGDTSFHAVSYPRIPLEVQERIILSDGWTRRGLIRASLVCQHWYTVMMQSFWAANPLIIDAGHDRHLRPLLENPKCRFIHHVQHLLIKGYSYIGSGFYEDVDITITLLVNFALRLRSIQLKCLRYHFMIPQTIASLETFKEVTSLEIDGVVYTDPVDFLSLLSAFGGRLQSLVFRYCLLLKDSGEPHDLPVPDMSSLRRLDITIEQAPAIEDVIKQFLLNPFPVERLNLAWKSTNFAGRDALAELVRHIGPALKSFHLDISVAARREEDKNLGKSLFQLRNNTSLTNLSIESIEIAEGRHYDHIWLERLLGSINSPSFQCLRVGILSSDEWEGVHEVYFKNFDWNIFDDTLTSNPYFDHWKTVEICVKSLEGVVLDNEDLESEFRVNLPKLDASGKLIITQETIPEDDSDDDDDYY